MPSSPPVATPDPEHPAQAADLDALFTRRLLVVSGKGGVGKTTVAIALALAAARAGLRVLLAQFESQVDAGTILGRAPVSSEVISLGDHLDAVNMTPRASLREFGMLVFRMRAIQRAVMENRMVRHFLRAIPGLDDYAMLGKAWHHTTELRRGEARYDVVVVDGPATGQMLKTLAVPRSILQVVPDSMLTRDAAAIQGLLQDPDQTAFIIVTLAEELPTSEALDLQAALLHDLALPVWGTVVNQVYPRVRCGPLLERPWAEACGDPMVLGLLRQARALARRRAVNDRHLKLLGERAHGELSALPLLFVDRIEEAHLQGLVPTRVDR